MNLKSRIKKTSNNKTLTRPSNNLGKVKVGYKVNNRPESSDTFIFYGGAAGPVNAVIANQLMPNCNSIAIEFVSDDPMQSCRQVIEYRKGKTLVAEGDGETIIVNKPIKGANGRTTGIQKVPLSEFTEEQQRNFTRQVQSGEIVAKLMLRMHFKVPALPFEDGVWTFESGGSETTVSKIPPVFDNALQKYGSVIGEKFILSVAKVKSQTTGNQFSVVSLTHFKEPTNTNEHGQLSFLYDARKHISAGDDRTNN